MPVMNVGDRVSFSITFKNDAQADAPVQSIDWSVSDPTAVRVETTFVPGATQTGFVVAIGANNTGEPADVLYDADVDMGPAVQHLTGKNRDDDRFVISPDPAARASAGVLTFGAVERVPVDVTTTAAP